MVPKRRLVCLRGHVGRQRIRVGTGSEHDALVLTTAAGDRFVLVRLGGNPFQAADLGDVEGSTVEAEGYVVGGELRYQALRSVSS